MRAKIKVVPIVAFADLPFRIRVGVTGHRTIEERELVSRKIREILHDRVWELFDPPVQRKEPLTRLAFTVLSLLAEGADCLVADEVLKTADSELEAVLPLAREDYLRDFSTPETKAEFRELLNRARKTTVIKEAGPDTELDEVRKKAYEGAGRYVVDHCDLLIAIWDGRPARGRGGTAEIIDYARNKDCPLVIISTTKAGDIGIEKRSGISGRTFSRIEMFNRFRISEKISRTYLNNMYGNVFRNPEGEKIDKSLKNEIREKILPWYVRASLISKKNQKTFLNAGLLVYLLSPLAVAAVAVGILQPDFVLPAFAFEFFILAAIFIILLLADKNQAHKKWIETRFLVERLRSAIFLITCGTRPSALALSPVLKQNLGAGEWTIRVFDEITKQLGEIKPCNERSCSTGIEFVRRHWLQDQINFHVLKAEKSAKISRWLEKSGWIVFFAAIFAAAWHILDILLGHQGVHIWLEKTVVYLAIVLPAFGAAIGGIRSHREYSRLAKRSQDMQAALHELDDRFAATTDVNKLRALLHEAEQLLLQENQEWFFLMKFVKVEPV